MLKNQNRVPTVYDNIVLVDDDNVNNLLNRQFLTFNLPNATITTFQYAQTVLDYLSNGKIQCPDLILLDINMPEMDGWEFLTHLSKMRVDCDVMMLSSSVHWDDIEKSKRFKHVKCYIEKPLTEDKIEHYIVTKNFEPIEVDRY